MNEMVSIIVPCYNQAQYLEECLQSILNQTYENWECLIVNDGSTDSTEKIALQWKEKDPRFIYLKKENGGLSRARNYGITKAKGKYILPLDSDDKIGKEYLKLGIYKLEKNKNIGVVYCKANFFGQHKGRWKLPPFNKKHLLCENHIFCSGIYLKEDWEKIGGYDINMKYGWEDWEFWINLLYTLNKTAYKLNYLGFYYRRKENSMGNFVANNEKIKLEIYDYIYNKHKKIYIEILGHPIISYKKIMKLEKKFNLIVKIYHKFL